MLRTVAAKVSLLSAIGSATAASMAQSALLQEFPAPIISKPVIKDATFLPRSINKSSFSCSDRTVGGEASITGSPLVVDQLMGAIAIGAIKQLSKEIVYFSSLKAGWDGVDSVAPNAFAVQQVAAYLNTIMSLGMVSKLISAELSASADGDVDLYWMGEDVFIDINFTGGAVYSYLARINGEVVASDVARYEEGEIPQELVAAIKQA